MCTSQFAVCSLTNIAIGIHRLTLKIIVNFLRRARNVSLLIRCHQHKLLQQHIPNKLVQWSRNGREIKMRFPD